VKLNNKQIQKIQDTCCKVKSYAAGVAVAVAVPPNKKYVARVVAAFYVSRSGGLSLQRNYPPPAPTQVLGLCNIT